MNKIKIGIAVADFNHEITFSMFNEAKKRAQELSIKVTYACFTPGVFDMPLIVEEMLKKKKVDFFVFGLVENDLIQQSIKLSWIFGADHETGIICMNLYLDDGILRIGALERVASSEMPGLACSRPGRILRWPSGKIATTCP